MCLAELRVFNKREHSVDTVDLKVNLLKCFDHFKAINEERERKEYVLVTKIAVWSSQHSLFVIFTHIPLLLCSIFLFSLFSFFNPRGSVGL